MSDSENSASFKLLDDKLLDAAAGGSIEAFNAALEAGGDINATNPEMRTALHHASMQGADGHAIIKKLLELGANVDALDDCDTTPLENACSVCDQDDGANAMLLLAGGAVPTKKAATDALTIPALAKLIFEKNPALIQEPDLVFSAAKIGSLAPLQLLKDLGANLAVARPDGCTALHSATVSDADVPEIVELLIKSGVDVNAAAGADGRTALHNAVMMDSNKLATVAALLAAGADKSMKLREDYGDEDEEGGRSPPPVIERDALELAQCMLKIFDGDDDPESAEQKAAVQKLVAMLA